MSKNRDEINQLVIDIFNHLHDGEGDFKYLPEAEQEKIKKLALELHLDGYRKWETA
jgi:hypothetical protein